MVPPEKWMKRGVIGIVITGIVCLIIEPLIALVGVSGIVWLVKNQAFVAMVILPIVGSFAILLLWRRRSRQQLDN